MICPACLKSSQRSIVRVTSVNGVRPGAISVKKPAPSDHYYDEDGVEHSHNPNVVVTQYLCSNGHRFEERSSWQCPCGWMVQQAEIKEL